jgi:hypothetical protein
MSSTLANQYQKFDHTSPKSAQFRHPDSDGLCTPVPMERAREISTQSQDAVGSARKR